MTHFHSWSEWRRDGDYHDERHCLGPSCVVGQSLCLTTGHIQQYRHVGKEFIPDEVYRSGTN